MFRTIERPTNATLRPCACAASSTCWMRCTWLAKLDTMMRRGDVAKTWSIAGASSRSDVVKPGTSAFVESVNHGNRVVPTVLFEDGETATNPTAQTVAELLAGSSD